MTENNWTEFTSTGNKYKTAWALLYRYIVPTHQTNTVIDNVCRELDLDVPRWDESTPAESKWTEYTEDEDDDDEDEDEDD